MASDIFVRSWVVFRAITTIGVVGDTSALPALRDILHGASSDHAIYFAINAVRRLTRKDVRDQPVEEMDVVKTRQRVLNLLKGLEMK